MDNGGEVYQMVKECITKLMVLLDNIDLGDLYLGIFKNGLKHGLGTENFGNGDYYKG